MPGLTTAEFLSDILPVKGWKCLTAFPLAGGAPMNLWFEEGDIDGMAAAALKLDATDRFSVSHACAGFRDKGDRYSGRKGENTVAVKSAWLDIDCGEGKPYLTQQDGGRALLAFCKAINVPFPLMVNSGYGIHAYWPFADDLDPSVWLGWTSNLAVLCERHGLSVDRQRTRDLSTALRTVGTHNRKHGQKKLVVGVPRAPVTIRD